MKYPKEFGSYLVDKLNSALPHGSNVPLVIRYKRNASNHSPCVRTSIQYEKSKLCWFRVECCHGPPRTPKPRKSNGSKSASSSSSSTSSSTKTTQLAPSSTRSTRSTKTHKLFCPFFFCVQQVNSKGLLWTITSASWEHVGHPEWSAAFTCAVLSPELRILLGDERGASRSLVIQVFFLLCMLPSHPNVVAPQCIGQNIWQRVL